MANNFEREQVANEYSRKNAMFLNQYALERLILRSLEDGKKSKLVKNYSREDVLKYLDNPHKNEKELRDISRILYNKSSQYRRTINYFAKMPTFSYIIEPIGMDEKGFSNPEKIRKQYGKISNLLELFNLSHEFLKVLLVAFKEDVFYGYEHMGKDTYFFQQLDPDFCTISSIEDGVYNLAFNFAYFEKHKEKIDLFPPEFKSKFNKYKNKTAPQWQELDPQKTICIKINEDTATPIPPLAGTFISLFDLEDYKKARRVKEKLGSYMLLAQKLPMSDDGERVNDFLIDYDTMMNFHNMAESVLPEEISMITSPMEIEAIDFSKGRDNIDNVGNAERDYWSGVGVSQLLFNTDKSSSIGLNMSVKTDEQIVFAVLRQMERWVNRRLKYEFSTLKFNIRILDMTIFNKEEVFKQALEASQYGVPAKTMIGASLGMSPTSMANMSFLENEVLKLHENMIPLQSSHINPNDEGGNPGKDDGDLSEEGLRSKDEEKNDRKG